MDSIKNILEQFASVLKTDVIRIVSRRPAFAESIESVVTESSVAILGSPFISVLIDGRKPTAPNAKKGEKSLREIIFDWIGERGITAKADKAGKVMNQESLSYAISTSIHMHGDLLYQYVQSGGKPKDIFATTITGQRINAMVNSIGSVYTASISSDLIKTLNK